MFIDNLIHSFANISLSDSTSIESSFDHPFIQFKDKLDKLDKPEELSDKCFAHILGDTFIEDTSFEGGPAIESLQYWEKIIAEILEGKAPLQCSTKPEILRDILEDIQDCVLSTTYLESGEVDAIEKLLHIVTTRLETRKRFALLLQHRGTSVAQDSHCFVCLIEKKWDDGQEKLFCSFLNKGEGIDLNPGWGFSSQLYEIQDPTLFSPESETGKTLITILQTFSKNDLGSVLLPHSSYEMYAFIKLLAGDKHGLRKEDALTFCTASRSGVCNEQPARLLIRNQIQRSSPDTTMEQEYKRIIFCGKFQALHSGIHTVSIEPELFSRATTQFANITCKMIDLQFIDADETHLAWALIEQAKQESVRRTKKHSKNIILPALNTPVEYYETFKPVTTKEVSSSSTSKTVLTPKTTTSWYFDCSDISPENFVSELERLLVACKQKVGTESVKVRFAIMHFIKNMPIPMGENDPFWERVPAKDLSRGLQLLFDLTTCLRKSVSKDDEAFSTLSACFKDFFITFLSFYAIADTLARRNPECMLKGFACSVPIEDVGTQFFLENGKDSVHLGKIGKYFSFVQKSAQANIFPYIWERTLLTDGEISNLHEENQGILSSHLMFIHQFIEKRTKKPSVKDYFDYFTVTYKQYDTNVTEAHFPKDIYILKYFADVAFHMVWSSSQNEVASRIWQILTGIDCSLSNRNATTAEIECTSKIRTSGNSIWVSSPHRIEGNVNNLLKVLFPKQKRSENEALLEKTKVLGDRELLSSSI